MTPLDDTETNDGCHGNELGDLVWGADLAEFFDGDGPPPGGEPPPGGGTGSFVDVPADHVFAADIEWLAAEGITRGCNPPTNDRFCPDGTVTRGQMAAFLVRALGLPAGPDAGFVDDDTSEFEADIDALAAAGITFGCGPDTFCPEDEITREQMASFLVRAFGWDAGADADLFGDDDASVHESDIDILGTAGVTRGCNPPTNDRFCPEDLVTRGEMAAFLHRAAG
jgi:hypothetical protein